MLEADGFWNDKTCDTTGETTICEKKMMLSASEFPDEKSNKQFTVQ